MAYYDATWQDDREYALKNELAYMIATYKPTNANAAITVRRYTCLSQCLRNHVQEHGETYTTVGDIVARGIWTR